MSTTAPPAPPTTQPTNPLPGLPEELRKGLRASIEKFGVLVPIVVDQYGRILDGRHRSEIAEEIGKDCPRHEIAVDEDTDLQALLTEINDQRRQRLTVAQRKQMVAALSEAGWSLRRIAKETGQSKSTVARQEAELSQAGQLKKPAKTTGKDGKARPARKPASKNGNGKQPVAKPEFTDDDKLRVVAFIQAAGPGGTTVEKVHSELCDMGPDGRYTRSVDDKALKDYIAKLRQDGVVRLEAVVKGEGLRLVHKYPTAPPSPQEPAGEPTGHVTESSQDQASVEQRVKNLEADIRAEKLEQIIESRDSLRELRAAAIDVQDMADTDDDQRKILGDLADAVDIVLELREKFDKLLQERADRYFVHSEAA